MVTLDDPLTWPYTILPVVRYPDNDAWPEVGILLPDSRPTVFLMNVADYSGVDSLKGRERKSYDTFDALAADGWQVD